MKGFIEVTSLQGNTRSIRADQIQMVNKKVVFTEKNYENIPELKDMECCTTVQLVCSCTEYYLKDSYEEVLRKIEEALE